MRAQGLNIMMSMKAEGKPVSFVEDCAVRLEDLADYTQRLTEIFRKHGTMGTWYAHASVGTLHVRPVLNLRLDSDVKAMRAIAEEAFEMVREYRGSHSGEHGDGIVRSEFHRDMFGERMVESFEWVKDRMDPTGLLNPGRIVRPPAMDDRSLFRYKPDYEVPELRSVFDWAGYPGAGRGFAGCGGDVQQQRRLPQDRRRRDVPLLPCDTGRARFGARPRQHTAPGDLRPIGAGGPDLR